MYWVMRTLSYVLNWNNCGKGYFSPKGVIKGGAMYNAVLYIKSVFDDYFSSDIL